MNRRLPLCALLGLLALPTLSPAALNLEGMTGYWMVPSAWTLKPDEVEIAANRHFIYTQDRYRDSVPDFNWMIGMGVLPHVEAVARYAMSPSLHRHGVRDLSFNAKVGWEFFSGTDHPLGVAAGSQDLWGGARYFHAKYAVLTQRWKFLEISGGWGDGDSHGAAGVMAGATPFLRRLRGGFCGGQVDLPLPDSLGLKASLLYDHDADRDMAGARLEVTAAATRYQLSLVRNLRAEEWEYGLSLAHALPPATAELPVPEPTWTRLRLGPWMQSFIGTEVGAFDAQLALEATPMVQPHPDWIGWGRMRSLLLCTRNFEAGKEFARYRQNPALWLEGAGIGWKPIEVAGSRAWLTAGMTDGSWQGGTVEGSVDVWGPQLRMGALAGYWYSTWWHQRREMWQPWLDWDSKDRSWFARLDAGRYWGQDDGVRLRLGRRYGRLAASMGLGRQDGIVMLDGRFEFELDGLGWRPGKAFVLEPNPRIGHGYGTSVAEKNGEGNPLHPDLGKDAPSPVRGRTGTWP